MTDPAGGSPPPPPAPPAEAPGLPTGFSFHEYEIERTLGGGGFGITYLARDGNLQLPVAIKEYFPNDLATRGADHTVQVRAGISPESQNQYEWGLERFLDEARVLATFRHPNIVRVLRYFRQNGTAYIVMEYESGQALKRWVPHNAPLARASVLGLVLPLLDGLEQVHKAGFLHRDIKPDNIFVRGDNTPVLLDFGSARRVSGNKDLTNIVSPGFAPFEQYHSQGHQGPWTDIYSIGAVLYWMVTGKKPVESAARVKSDSMMPAITLAEISVYGEALLNAIDHALQPDEARRPQSVAEFRSALLGPGSGAPQARSAGGTAARHGTVAGSQSTSGATSGSAPRRNLLGTILFLDLVGYSVRSVDDQAAIKRLFTELVNKALRGVPEDSRISIDTGDGAAVCFMGDPEEALHSGLLLRDLIAQRYAGHLSARIGLHMGPVRVITDINERTNVIGDGINVAQRVMDFAQPNQVVVSRAYYDVVSRITDDTADMFSYLGQFEDKHGRLHELYGVGQAHKNTTRREGPSTGYSQTVPAQASPLDDEALHDIEAELARHIGPLARVLVRKASAIATSAQDLREALAVSIQEPKAREQFLAGDTGPLSSPTRSHPVGPGRGMTQPRGHTAPSTRSAASPSIPMRSAPPSQPVSGPRSNPGTTTRPATLSADDIAALEQVLSKFIGPMGRMLVRKEIGKGGTLTDLVAGLAATLDTNEQREAFQQAVHKALPRRSF